MDIKQETGYFNRKELKRCFPLGISIIVSFVVLLLSGSCNKNDETSATTSSIKVIPTENEPGQVRIASSAEGKILAYVSSGNGPLVPQELFLIEPSGEVIKSFNLSDTNYQFMSATPGINGGFFISASGNNLPYITNYRIDANGDIIWTNVNPLSTSNYNLNEPAICLSRDNNYLVMFQKYGSGFYIQKLDQIGNEISEKRIPPPNAMHYGTGSNYGEKVSNFFQANDSLIIIQGTTFDKYSEIIENCFLRAVNADIVKKWYSSNYDSTHIELASGLYLNANNKIVLFGSKASGQIYEYYGEVFNRTYSLDGILENETVYPRVGGSSTKIIKSIKSPDGGYLMIGSNGQLSYNDLVSPNNIVLMKLDSDLRLTWSKSIETSFPAKGFDAVYLKDGSLGIIGLLKDNYKINKLIYMHLDAAGNLINN